MKKDLGIAPPEGVSEVVRDHWIDVNIVLPQPITMVTMIDGSMRVNATLKSWVMYCNPRNIMVGCIHWARHAKNILEKREFVVNIPSKKIFEQTMVTATPYPR